ncbi:SURF1 family cytochrome oxidase biogenesis protein [Luteipulveratus flavus]|uniref:SURF1-like protein n=1 Tax=Luteipulveratus flavus TaxID=3031728 RepID=A0ABT6C5A3_9MICO|nr:SURF1 family protein [Luteipulveratus sp. YIM 133296]MDF8264023.1 SURF1 family protein [Luteipulveratus sp. YIM 133296]
MLHVLLSRRWLAWLAVAVVVSVACLLLGRWQWHRWESKHAMQTRISENYDASPVALGQILPTVDTPLPGDREWTQVRLQGEYQAQQRQLVRNRPHEGSFGYEVVVPLRLADGASVLVDRGWVPNGPNAATPPSVPATPTGPVTVVGWMRPGEPSLGRAPIAGQLSSINVRDAQSRTGGRLHDAYVLMRGERLPSGATPVRPQALEKPDQGSAAGINLSYAIQWWVGMLAVPAYVLFAARREARDRSGVVRPAKPKKVRIWDEEDA